ncbi:putative Oxidoreductase [Streptomyces viridochromogenes Tue57]|uniref:Putative Oxidoreductase n=1 Tax=Streptomyces viridochromogenes Tue57 TaxID=1160705 RepID=L8P960_STRVR|nr:putative Oxidoreductase [Streptomyces viridochromogenes Tue57]
MVVVGAGMAGVQTAVALREQGFTGPVTLIGAEPHQPYDRPPLSKAVLLGKAEGSAFDVDFEALGIELRLGREVLGVRPADRELDTEAGPVPYDVLVIATGAEPIRLPGAEGVPGVHLLRTLDDAERLRPVLARQHDIVVVGAGWIGAEFATAAREAGCAVTVVEAADRPLAGALPAEVAAPMTAWYEGSGAVLRTHARVERVEPGAVILDDGSRLPAGAVVVGIGARPPRPGSPVRASSSACTARSSPTTTCVPRCPTSTRSATAPPSPRAGTANACWSTTGTTPCRARVRSPPTSSARPPWSTTRCRTSGRSSSAASCSTPATTPPPTRPCGAATRRAPPGPSAG